MASKCALLLLTLAALAVASTASEDYGHISVLGPDFDEKVRGRRARLARCACDQAQDWPAMTATAGQRWCSVLYQVLRALVR